MCKKNSGNAISITTIIFLGESMNQNEFLNKIKPYVLEDMKKSKILASMTAAQALIESKYGQSLLAVKANNLFGIKGTYLGQSVVMPTKEWTGKTYIKINAKFRKYPSWKESINDHSDMFHRMSRYENLIGVTNYIEACTLIKKDGYATAPDYTNTLVSTIQKYLLYNWDKEVLDNTKNPYPIPSKSIKLNDRGISVQWLQTQLNLKGYNLVVDGIAGNMTIGAVMDFQKKNSLKVDGIAGVKTITKLYE